MRALSFTCVSSATESLGDSFVSQINYREYKALVTWRLLCGASSSDEVHCDGCFPKSDSSSLRAK